MIAKIRSFAMALAGSTVIDVAARPRNVRKRLGTILEYLSASGRLTVEELIRRTGASPATVRRDLRTLQRGGFVRREHGEVFIAEPVAFEAFLEDPGFREQVHSMAPEKRRIGAAASALIENGETLGIAPGTTAAQIARNLQSKKDLTVVTNGLNVAMDLSRRRDIRVHLTGGYLSGDWFALVGPRAMEFIPTMFTAKFFFGANGVHPEHGITDRHPEEAAMNRAMAYQSQKRILVVDHTKFGHVAGYLVCPVGDLHTIITDIGAPDEVVAPFVQRGVEVLRV